MFGGGGRSGSKESTGSRGSRQSGGYGGSAITEVSGNAGRRPSQTGASSVSPRPNHYYAPPNRLTKEDARPASIGPDPNRRPAQGGKGPVISGSGKTVCLGAKRKRWLVKVQAASAFAKAGREAKERLAREAAEKERGGAPAAASGRMGSKEASGIGARTGSKEPAEQPQQTAWKKMMASMGCSAADYDKTPKAGNVKGDWDVDGADTAFGELSLGGPAPRVVGKQTDAERKVAL